MRFFASLIVFWSAVSLAGTVDLEGYQEQYRCRSTSRFVDNIPAISIVSKMGRYFVRSGGNTLEASYTELTNGVEFSTAIIYYNQFFTVEFMLASEAATIVRVTENDRQINYRCFPNR